MFGAANAATLFLCYGYYHSKAADTFMLIYRYPGTGEYDKFFNEGVYTCAGCGTPLYKSTTKFNSGCGWPAFFEGLPGAINRHVSSPFCFFLATRYLAHFSW